MPKIDQLMPVPHPLATPEPAKDLVVDLPAEWFLPSVHSMYFQLFSRLLALPMSAVQRDSLA